MKTTVLSIFEGGYQPITALSGFTAIRDAGHDAGFVDLYVDGPEALAALTETDLFAISIPLFDALKSVPDVARQIRSANPAGRIAFFGQYASINPHLLAGPLGDYAIVGEWEKPLAGLVDMLSGRSADVPPGVADAAMIRAGAAPRPYPGRHTPPVPDRTAAADLAKYPQPHLEKLLGHQVVVGGLETTRGCHHKCTYCSVYAAYDGKVILSNEESVLRDCANLVSRGMQHLTFMDADFLNAKRFAMSVLRRLHDEFPALTFDMTTRVDHLLENPAFVDEMAGANVRVITSALEFPSQFVLDEVFKEMTVPMIEDAIAVVRRAGITLNPTFIMFNPWVGLEDIALFHDFVDRNNLEDLIDPVQYETRLHLYKGSPLLRSPSVRSLNLTEREFDFDWQHPDPRVDELFLASRTPPSEFGGFKRCCLKC